MRRILEQMETPPLIHELLGLVPNVSPEQLPGVERMFKLSHYFGGLTVLTRETPAGLEVVASGPEVAAALEHMTQEEIDQCVLSIPDEFEDLLIALPPPAHRRTRRVTHGDRPIPA